MSEPLNNLARKLSQKIDKFRQDRKCKQSKDIVNTPIRRSNKLVQALNLPKVANLNPRSIYNKVDEFCTIVEEQEIDIFLFESHERWYST